MNRTQLLAICVCFGLIVFEASITVGVMPVYAVQLGADSATTGIFLAFQFLTVGLGNIAGGWLSDRFGQRKRMLLICFLLWIPAALLMTQATTLPSLILTTGVLWLPGGVTVATLNIITGLSAAPHERGRVFGWISLSSGTGSLIAGLIGGPFAERWGFPALCLMLAAGALVMFLIARYIRDAPPRPVPAASDTSSSPAPAGIGSLIYLILTANLFARLGAFTSDLGRPLAMTGLGLDAAAVSGAIAFSSALTLPLPLIMGRLSDRMGRKRLLIACYGVGSLGILILSVAGAPWHFWLSAALAATINASNGLGQAYIADLAKPEALGRSMSLLSTTSFFAGIIGLGGAGYVMQAIGISATVILGALLPLIGIGIILRLSPQPTEKNLALE